MATDSTNIRRGIATVVLSASILQGSWRIPPIFVAQGSAPIASVEPGSSDYGSPVHLADLQCREITESSGIAASRRNPNLLWTHNDSGDRPLIYAFDRRGRHRGVWQVLGAKAEDWEDMAIGPGPNRGMAYVYLGDIGDNW